MGGRPPSRLRFTFECRELFLDLGEAVKVGIGRINSQGSYKPSGVQSKSCFPLLVHQIRQDQAQYVFGLSRRHFPAPARLVLSGMTPLEGDVPNSEDALQSLKHYQTGIDNNQPQNPRLPCMGMRLVNQDTAFPVDNACRPSQFQFVHETSLPQGVA